MSDHSVDKLPKEIQLLFEKAHQDNITPETFCRMLTSYGISKPLKVMYIRDAFKLPFKSAKEIVVQVDYGSSGIWVEQISNVIDELDLNKD